MRRFVLAVTVAWAALLFLTACTENVQSDMASSVCTSAGAGHVVISLTSLSNDFSSHTITSVTVNLEGIGHQKKNSVVLPLPANTVINPGGSLIQQAKVPLQYVVTCTVTAVMSKG